jgi:hypothetical protein
MSSRKSRSEIEREGLPTTDHMDRLVAVFETLAGEIKAVRQTLDIILDDFQWALNNDKFGPDCFPKTAALRDLIADHLAEKPDNDKEDLPVADTAPATPAGTPAPDRRAPAPQPELWQ